MHIRHEVSLLSIQPSQLYINAAKLAAVLNKFSKQQLAQLKFPVIQVRDQLVFTDQHTRALAAHLYGIERVQIYMDADDLSYEMYAVCVDWCQEEKIHSIVDLVGRVIDDVQYQELWISRCRIMHHDITS